MKELKELFQRVIQRVNINLRELEYDVRPYVESLIPPTQMTKFYAFYGISPDHRLNLQFTHSALAGSYFLGKCKVSNSLLYKTDVRGDELKKKGEIFKFKDYEIPITRNEGIHVEDSFLIKTLVHNFSHDPESLERFFIINTISTHYANIHGSPTDGTFLGAFATIDLTTVRDCVIGAFSYIQAEEINHKKIEPGTVWIRKPDMFNFLYQFPANELNRYISCPEGIQPHGILIDFVEDRKEAFMQVFEMVNKKQEIDVPDTASLDRYAVTDNKTRINDNVLVAQRAFLQNSWLGKGANAQENCYIINSRLQGYNVTAHGAKIIEADLGKNVFVGFNSFLNGRTDARLKIGQDCVIMPHTIIDSEEQISIPDGTLVWGLNNSGKDLEINSMPIEKFKKIDSGFSMGNMFFEGSGNAFITGFSDRIHHILEANGAFFDGTDNRGHAQVNQNLSFNTIQPYPKGDQEGLYPAIYILP